MAAALGFDVSHHHPVKDWAALAAAPQHPVFMGVKATEGHDFVDPKLSDHRQGFRDSPLLLALYYHYARPGDPREQARRLMDAAGPLEPRERLALDFEVDLTGDATRTIDWLEAFYDELTGGVCSDRRPWIYTSKHVWDDFAGSLPWLTGMLEVDLWVKRYSHAAPLLPTPWAERGYQIWQNTDGASSPFSLPGVGPCDGDLWNGTEDELAAYMTVSSQKQNT